MTEPGESTMTTRRIERLLRSLVGVTDLRLVWGQPRALRGVHILRDTRVQPHQLIRNVVSGLHAGFGIQVLPTQVHVHDDANVFEAIIVAADVLTPTATAADTAVAAPVAEPANGNGNGHSKPGNGGPKLPATPRRAPARAEVPVRREQVPEPPMVAKPSRASTDVIAAAAELVHQRETAAETHAGLVLERIDVERRSGTLRCRTVLSLAGRTYAAIAEVPDGPAAEAELAARVAVDALRAGGLTPATLEGVGFITIAGANYCVATVREPGKPASRAGAAALIDSMAASATAAVLAALGNFTDTVAQVRVRAGN
jgi:hypothetical protein